LDCFALVEERDNMMEEEQTMEEFFEEYFQTPETPSSAHFPSASSSSSSSAAAAQHSSAHGKVCNAHSCPSQMLLLMNLHVSLSAPFWFFCPPTAAIVGEMQT
jgi:hypothetical protein